jgi:hypothetical protein
MSRTPQPPTPPGAIRRAPISPARVRTIGADSFAFVPHRFLRDGFLATLNAEQRGLYFFLVLAADRFGVSFYHYETICSVLGLPLESYIGARDALIRKDLIAFDGTRFQVLSLPERPIHDTAEALHRPVDFEDRDPATIRTLIRRSLAPRS